ncbi:MAG: hypothetical protein JNL74_03870 [Fibrobacteres bacterium]|nr:hypothetical protein [Fibrobacterota bacterium]
MKFFILDCNEPLSVNSEAMMEIHNTFRVGGIRLWSSGKGHDKPVPTPIEIPFDTFREYSGAPIEFLDVGIPIMSLRMANALLDAGVNNIEFYDASLVNKQSGKTFHYKAFNIIGLVSAADLKRSAWHSLDGDVQHTVSFERLILDESLSERLDIFRLAENVKAIIVSERIKHILLSKGINTLKFISPEQWTMV